MCGCRRGSPCSPAAAFQSNHDESVGRASGHSFPGQLQLHCALDELGWTGVIDEFNAANRLKEQSVPEPILITTNGTVLAGFGRWRSALFDDLHEINCIEYPLTENEALQYIISHHHPQRGWNDFVRICL